MPDRKLERARRASDEVEIDDTPRYAKLDESRRRIRASEARVRRARALLEALSRKRGQ